MTYGLLVAAWLATSTLPTHAQTVGPALPGYVHSVWTTEHGLPQNIVLNLVQTRDGYLWVGTGNGLARFDGRAFRVFDMVTTPELPSAWISALHEDANGTLWIGTDLGLVEYTAGTFTRHLSGGIRSIQTDARGLLWVTTLDTIERRDGNGWTSFPLAETRVIGHVVDGDGVLWIGTEDGLIEWNGKPVRTFTLRDGLPTKPVKPLLVDRTGSVWVRGFPGLARIDRETGAIEPAPGGLDSAHVHRMIESPD